MKKTVFAFGWLRPKRCPREAGCPAGVGYTLDLESIPALIQEDSVITQEVYAFFGMCGHYTVIDA